MNQRMLIGLMLFAWCLYLVSLFLPAADLSLDTMNGGGDGDFETGIEIMEFLAFPFFWVFGIPFVYLLVNCVFLYSVGIFWRRLSGQKHTIYTVLISLSAVASWLAAELVAGCAVGYFSWTASITLATIVFWVPLNNPHPHQNA